MKIVKSYEITAAVRDLCVPANTELPDSIAGALLSARETEPWPAARAELDVLCRNLDIAREMGLPICQDTGMACVFAEIGQDVHIEGSFEEAVHEGVRQGYAAGYLRKSVVGDPLRRVNTGDNTPAIINVRLVEGDSLRITLAPKGFGSENMSRLKMLNPGDGEKGVRELVVETVRLSGANPCPPVVIGVGIGGTFDRVALLAKQALLRSINIRHPDPFYAQMELDLLREVNMSGIGPQGFGGATTALAVMIETAPTHIAGLPAAVNMGCHVTRHKEVVL